MFVAFSSQIEQEKVNRKERKKRMAAKNKTLKSVEVGFGRTSKNTNVYNKTPNFQTALLNSPNPKGPQDRDLNMPLTAAATMDSTKNRLSTFESFGFDASQNQSLAGSA